MLILSASIARVHTQNALPWSVRSIVSAVKVGHRVCGKRADEQILCLVQQVLHFTDNQHTQFLLL